MYSGLLRHHCLQLPHGMVDSTVFISFSCAHGCFRDLFLDLSRLLGHCALSLLSFDATRKSLPRWRLALAQEAARGTLSSSSSLSF